MVVRRVETGLLVPPPVVLERLEETFSKYPFEPSPEYRRAMLNRLTLSYYHPGTHVAYRETDEGPEVVALMGDLKEFFAEATEEETQDVILRRTEDWYE